MKTAEEILQSTGGIRGVYSKDVVLLAMSILDDQFKPKWISANEPPKTRGSYSELDYLVVTKYRYAIGRTFRGKWVDMENRPIGDVEYYMLLPEPLPTKP